MKLHRMQLPREVIVGNETLSLVSDICKRLGFSESAFVVTGPETHHVAGRRVIDLLHDKGMDVDHLIVASSTVWDVRAVEERIRELISMALNGRRRRGLR
jgi:Glycerol dehydrogenase and related enzymes